MSEKLNGVKLESIKESIEKEYGVDIREMQGISSLWAYACNTRTDSEEVERLRKVSDKGREIMISSGKVIERLESELSEALRLLKRAEQALQDVTSTFNYGVYDNLADEIEEFYVTYEEEK